jgi:hypothetical protein
VQLCDRGRQPLGERRGARGLEGAGGDDDLVGLHAAPVQFDAVAGAGAGAVQPAHAATELDRKVAGVVGEVGDDLVARGVVVRIAGKGLAGEAVVARRREEPQRVPPLAPRGRGGIGGLEDDEVAVLVGEVAADGETGLTAADDDDLAVGGAHGIWTSVMGLAVDRTAT